jgi:hypothetical protein
MGYDETRALHADESFNKVRRHRGSVWFMEKTNPVYTKQHEREGGDG